jgi:hypothetical protein
MYPYGFVTAVLLFFGLFFYYAVARFALIRWLNIGLLSLTVISMVIAGENGRKFIHWTGFSVLDLRKLSVLADQQPISTTTTRIIVYSMFAAEICLLVWWWVVNRAPILGLEGLSDPSLVDIAMQQHYNNQFRLYLGLFPMLFLPMVGSLKGSERIPIFGFLLRRTMMLPMLAPLIAGGQLYKLIDWWIKTYKPELPF